MNPVNQIFKFSGPPPYFFEMQVGPDDPVLRLKENLSLKFSADPRRIHLFFDSSKDELPDDARPRDRCSKRVDPFCCTDILIIEISGYRHISTNDHVSLLVRVVPYFSSALELSGAQTIRDLMKAVEMKTRIPIKLQRLYVQKSHSINGTTTSININELHPDLGIIQAGIESGDEIRVANANDTLIRASVAIRNVKMFEFNVTPSETVEFIKERIAEAYFQNTKKLSKNTQNVSSPWSLYPFIKLYFNDKLLSDKDSLDDIDFRNDNTLSMIISNTEDSDKKMVLLEFPLGGIGRFLPFYKIPLFKQNDFITYLTNMSILSFGEQGLFYGDKQLDMNLSLEANGITSFPAKLFVRRR